MVLIINQDRRYNPVSLRAALEIVKLRPVAPIHEKVMLRRLRGRACRHISFIGFKSKMIFVCGRPKGHKGEHEDVYGSLYLKR